MTSQNFIDANVFIYAYTRNERTEEAQEILRKGGATNALVLTEAFAKIKTINKDHEFARKAIRNILKTFEILPITADTVFDATKITKLNIFDAIHYTTAQGKKLITYDKKLKNYLG